MESLLADFHALSLLHFPLLHFQRLFVQPPRQLERLVYRLTICRQ